MAKAPYRTQSDTLKLQRLIGVLKERGSDLANSLEDKAKDFLNDVKQKRASPLIPHYDSDASSGGSSFGKNADDDDDWGVKYAGTPLLAHLLVLRYFVLRSRLSSLIPPRHLHHRQHRHHFSWRHQDWIDHDGNHNQHANCHDQIDH